LFIISIFLKFPRFYFNFNTAASPLPQVVATIFPHHKCTTEKKNHSTAPRNTQHNKKKDITALKKKHISALKKKQITPLKKTHHST